MGRYREIFKEINREDFISVINKSCKFDKPDYEVYFEVEGGRGAVMVLQKRFMEEVNKTMAQIPIGVISNEGLKLDSSFTVTRLFISGFGWVKIDYDKTFDRYGTFKDVRLLHGLPEDSYKYSLYSVDGTDRKFIGVFSTIKEITFLERIKQLLGKTKPKLEFINW